MLTTIISLCYENYEPQPLHTWLLYVGTIWFAIALNIFGCRVIPALNRFICEYPRTRCGLLAKAGVSLVHFSMLSLIITIVTLLLYAFPNYAASKTFSADITNSWGWSSEYGFLLCVMNSIYGFLGLDSGAHMCEEIPHPRVNVPKVIVRLSSS